MLNWLQDKLSDINQALDEKMELQEEELKQKLLQRDITPKLDISTELQAFLDKQNIQIK